MPKLVKRYPKHLRGVQKRFTPAASLAAPGFSASLTVPAIAGILVTPQLALTFTAYYAAVKVICEDLGSLPLVVFQKQKGGGSVPHPEHPVSQRFNWSADGECPAMSWRESGQSHILGWGNLCAEIDWSTSGEVLGLHLIHPSLILPKREMKTGELFYELQTSSSQGQTKRKIPPWKIFHIGAIGFNGLWGYSPVALARESIGLGKAAEQFGAAFFGNGATPSGAITYPGALKPEAIKNLRESINLIHQGSSAAHKLMILEQGATWAATGLSPEATQVLSTRQFQVIEICRILRLPPHKIADYTHVQPTNLEVINDDYVTSCLRTWCYKWEQAISFKLLSQQERNAGFYVRFDLSELLRANTKDRGDFYVKMQQIGLYSRDEIAALEHMNPIGPELGGDKRFRLSTLLELDKEQPEKPAQQFPSPDKPGNDSGDSRIGAYLNGNASKH